MIIYSKGAMIAVGRLGKDAKFRIAGAKNTHFCSFSIAAEEYTDEEGQRKTRWIDVDAAFELADVAKDLRKGDHVLVAGMYNLRTYQKDGETKSSHELKAEIVLPAPKPLRSVDQLAADFPGTVHESADAVDDAFDGIDGDGELPF